MCEQGAATTTTTTTTTTRETTTACKLYRDYGAYIAGCCDLKRATVVYEKGKQSESLCMRQQVCVWVYCTSLDVLQGPDWQESGMA
eukprot:6477890-Amphidinium_carterae.1